MFLLAALTLIAVASFLFVRAQLDPGAPVAGVTAITVRDNEFAPAAVAVSVGTELTWRWAGEAEHNVIGDGFASPVQAAGEFVHRFAAPGSYDYQCTLHTFMRGRVVVTE